MTLENALTRWGYKSSNANIQSLQRICRLHPEKCISLTQIRIRNQVKKIYLPDGRATDTYVQYLHIARAIQNNAHLFPETVGLTDEKLVEQLRQLTDAGIIEKHNNRRKNATEDYNTTLITDRWIHQRKNQRMKVFIKNVNRLCRNLFP